MAKMNYILNRYAVNPALFNDIRLGMKINTVEVKNVLKFSLDNKEYKYIDNMAYYSKIDDKEWLLIQGGYLFSRLGRATRDYNKYCLLLSDENVSTYHYVFTVPYLNTCNKYMRKVLSDTYTDEEIDQALDEHSLKTHVKPLHKFLPHFYKTNVIHKFHNCVYYDINNAHLDALVEIFPKAKDNLVGMRKMILRYKKLGKKYDALRLKYYINIWIGGFGKKYPHKDGTCTYAPHRGTWEWIVDRTRNKLIKIIEDVKGYNPEEMGYDDIIYANTDGVIIYAPKTKIQTSNELGECKSELKDDVVYALDFEPTEEQKKQGYTPYWCYQYTNAHGDQEIKGNVAHEVRKHIDLRIGQFPIYKLHREDGCCVYSDVEIVTGGIVEHG